VQKNETYTSAVSQQKTVFLQSMKWIGERISVVDTKRKATIVIVPQRKVWLTGLMGAWIAMWYAIGASVVGAFFMMDLSQQEKLILVIFMSFWLYFAVRVTRSFLWLMWGAENIKIDEIALTIKNSTGKFGRATPYFLENIRKVRIAIPKERSWQQAWESAPWIGGEGRIEFDYMGKVVRLGRKLPEKEAVLLFQLITKKVEVLIKNKKRAE